MKYRRPWLSLIALTFVAIIIFETLLLDAGLGRRKRQRVNRKRHTNKKKQKHRKITMKKQQKVTMKRLKRSIYKRKY